MVLTSRVQLLDEGNLGALPIWQIISTGSTGFAVTTDPQLKPELVVNFGRDLTCVQMKDSTSTLTISTS
jgi:hypothetical protein